MTQVKLDFAYIWRDIAWEEFSKLRPWGLLNRLTTILGKVMLVVIIFNLKYFDLTEFSRDGYQLMIAVYVIDVDMKHIWIKLALSIVKELRCRIFYLNVKASWRRSSIINRFIF